MAKRIMVVGTMSNSGKSVVTAGLCRIFKQDGHRVMPFKSQNMALNSFITKEGLEMGRAQVMQAEAAGVEPSVLMNPILLKPTNNTGSQVIINGEVFGTVNAANYYEIKKQFVPEIKKAFSALAAQCDIVAIEGAGSPAEINLKQEDFVNMGLAEMVDSPVLLVGDIDRGGVFASLYGTVMLLEPQERARIKGVVINKFRGDVELLKPGLEMLEKLIGIPVLGVIPYFHLDLDDEDSLSDRFHRATHGAVDVAVLRLPRISNFTDFNALERSGVLGVRYVESPAEFGAPDLVILPGTKNTMGDLRWLRENGLEALVKKHAAAGGAVLGICGGYQMLGETLCDPHGVEEGGEMRGLELLPVRTVFAEHKTRTQTEGVFECGGEFSGLAGASFEGYEIHMGVSEPTGSCEPASGGGASKGAVLGTYIHGLFDDPALAGRFVSLLAARKGIDAAQYSGQSAADYKNEQYDKLADILRGALDMNAIYQILEAENAY